MDIMNIMKVSSSKFTLLTLIAAVALAGASGMIFQDAHAAAITFTANHNSTTTTEIIFSEPVNGTLRLNDFVISPTGDLRTGNLTITAITNGTTPGASMSTSSVDQSVAASTDYATEYFGFMNDTQRLLITHEALPYTSSTYVVNYTGGIHMGSTTLAQKGVNIHEAHISDDGQLNAEGNPSLTDSIAASFTATATDSMAPTPVSAKTIGDSKIAVTFSETVGVVNSTISDFSIAGSNDAIISTVVGNSTEKLILTFQNPIDFRDTFTLTYSTSNWITDHVVDAFNVRFDIGSWYNATAQENGQETGSASGVGNKLGNFTGLLIQNNYETAVDNCIDCRAPTVSSLELSVDSSSSPIQIDDDNPVSIGAEIGDTITVFLTLEDNKGAANIPFVGMYTNFDGDASFDNWYFTNNFDNGQQMSTSYYEWNTRSDDVSYDLTNSITWDEPVRSVDSITGDTTFAFTLTIEDSMASSEIWIDASDNSGNYVKQQLPITLEVTGDPSLTFASSDNQKVTSFFNDTVLLAIISAFDVSSDNTSELSAALGIEEGTLPTWTTELATWASEDKIDVADMVIAVEYVINQ